MLYRFFHLTIMALLMGLALASPALAAPIASEYDLDALLPDATTLPQLRTKIDADPDNHDNYFAYAHLAIALGQPGKAVWAYEQLLAVDPSLNPLKLDLSLVYISLGRYDDARTLLKQVLAARPPEAVQNNIRAVLERIDQSQKRNHFLVSATAGIGSDSNASAAPNSGNVLIFDTTVPLGQGATAQSDLQAFAAASLAHVYEAGNVAPGIALNWQSSFLAYSTHQQDLHNLDLSILSLRTGPEFVYRPWDVHLSLAGGYNYLVLDEQSYLRNPSGEVKIDFPITFALRGWMGYTAEYREFMNADTISTYTDRAGRAGQVQWGLRYAFSERSLWEAVLTKRREGAKKEYFSNDQDGIVLSNTYALPPGLAKGLLDDHFIVTRAGYKLSHYDEPDFLISTKSRNDIERSIGVTVGRKFPHDLTLAGSYTYTESDSNLENYRYYDHRYTLSLTKNFTLDVR